MGKVDFDGLVEGRWELLRADALALERLDDLRAAARNYVRDAESEESKSYLEDMAKRFAYALVYKQETLFKLRLEESLIKSG